MELFSVLVISRPDYAAYVTTHAIHSTEMNSIDWQILRGKTTDFYKYEDITHMYVVLLSIIYEQFILGIY